MNEPRYDVIAIGNAIVDVIAACSDELIEELQLNRGGMTLVDTDRARELYEAMGPARETSGGSAANTLAGLAALGAQCSFIGQVARDQHERHREALGEDPEHARIGQLAEREKQRGGDRRHPCLRLRARQAKSTPRTS